jgi:hypothetical protein
MTAGLKDVMMAVLMVNNWVDEKVVLSDDLMVEMKAM